MIPLNTIFSSIQNEINDIEAVRVQLGEYLDFAEQTLNEIARETDMYLGRYTFIPVPTSASPSINYVVVPEVDSVGNIINPYKLERVMRASPDGNTIKETREYSMQTISATYANNASFRGMRGVLDSGAFATLLNNPDNANKVDGSLVLFFTKVFDIGEALIIDFVQHSPFRITRWNANPSIAIPAYMRDAFETIMLSKVVKRLFFKGDEAFGSRYQMSLPIAMSALDKLKAYARNHRDKQSPYQIQPSRWLPE